MSFLRTGIANRLSSAGIALLFLVSAGCDCGGCGKTKNTQTRTRAEAAKPASRKKPFAQQESGQASAVSATAGRSPERPGEPQAPKRQQQQQPKRYELQQGTWIPIVGDVPIDESKLPPKVKQPRQVYRTMVLLKKFQQTMPPPPPGPPQQNQNKELDERKSEPTGRKIKPVMKR